MCACKNSIYCNTTDDIGFNRQRGVIVEDTCSGSIKFSLINMKLIGVAINNIRVIQCLVCSWLKLHVNIIAAVRWIRIYHSYIYRLTITRENQVASDLVNCSDRVTDNDGDFHFLAGFIAEAHLEFSIDAQQTHLLRDIGQEQNRNISIYNVGKIGIEFAAYSDIVGGKVQFSADHKFAIGTEDKIDLTIKYLL